MEFLKHRMSKIHLGQIFVQQKDVIQTQNMFVTGFADVGGDASFWWHYCTLTNNRKTAPAKMPQAGRVFGTMVKPSTFS